MKKRILAVLLAVLMVLPMTLSVMAADKEEKLDYVNAIWYNPAHRLTTMELFATSPDGNMLLYVDGC